MTGYITVELGERASPSELREAADIAESNANTAESERRGWQKLADALRARAKEVEPQ